MITTKRYTRCRSFSRLGGLQQAHQIRYSLAFDPQGAATYEICTIRGDGTWAQRRTVRGLCERKARWILEYLYENAVPPENGWDILEDLLRRV